MEYIPEKIKHLAIAERAAAEAVSLTSPALLRRLRITNYERDKGVLYMFSPQLALPLAIPFNLVMTFGTEDITAIEYFRQVIESGDMIDAVVEPVRNGLLPVNLFWIHIEYVGTPSQAGRFRKKEDGLFAMWTKAGEKAERVVARKLRDDCGHSFTDAMFMSPGYFEIRYVGKRLRKPDRICQACKLTFEVKKRNNDRHFRPSHSPDRPFAKENQIDGWHAFVFADMSIHYIPNAAIAQAIADGNFIPGSNQYDSWAQVDHLTPADPPYCKGRI